MSGKTENSEKEFDAEIHVAFNKGPTRLFKNVTGNFWTGKFTGFTAGIAKIANAQRVKTGVGGIGGSDRIGFHQIEITPAMCGKKICVFTAIELKTRVGYATEEQKNFIQFVNNMGGIAGIARSVDEVSNLFDSWLARMQS